MTIEVLNNYNLNLFLGNIFIFFFNSNITHSIEIIFFFSDQFVETHIIIGYLMIMMIYSRITII